MFLLFLTLAEIDWHVLTQQIKEHLVYIVYEPVFCVS